ncbi:MAG: PAS domain-containing protein, partial [Nitrososphaerales archaeon]
GIVAYVAILRVLQTRESARASAAVLESDLESRERLLAAISQQRRLLETILEADPNGIAVVAGPDLCYQLVNSAYRRLIPHPDVDPLGRPYEGVWGDAECVPRAALGRRVAETGEEVDQAAGRCPSDVGPAQDDAHAHEQDLGERFLGAHLRRLAWEEGQAVLIVLQDDTAAEAARLRADHASIEARRRADELSVIFEAMVEGVIVFDEAGTPVRANRPAAALMGASLGRPDRDLMVKEQQMRRVDGALLSNEELPSYRALQGETVRMDRFVVTDGAGHDLTIQSSASPLWVDGRIAGAVAVWHDVTELERAEAQARERARQRAVRVARQHLSRVWHDSVSQALYGIALGSRTALALVDSDRAGTVEALEYVVSLTQLALTEMRAVIFELRPEALEKEGLVAGLVRQTAAIRARHRLAVQEELCGEPSVTLKVKEALYWIAQEALNNAVKHARAKVIRLRLEECGDHLELEISDDGAGFDPTQAFPGHLGLQSMGERAGEQGGALQIDSLPGRGTRVLAMIPAQPGH